jgi:hypothetical protein
MANDKHLFIQEVLSNLTENITFAIKKDPKIFGDKAPDRLYAYISGAIVREMAAVFKRKKKLPHFLYIHDDEHNVPAEVEMAYLNNVRQPDAALMQQDRIKLFVRAIKFELKKSIRFRDYQEFLLWPMVLCINRNSDKLFDNFVYRDRVSLKAMLARCARRVNIRLEKYNK